MYIILFKMYTAASFYRFSPYWYRGHGVHPEQEGDGDVGEGGAQHPLVQHGVRQKER